VLFERKDVSKLGGGGLSKRTVSGITLTLLLIGMLTLAFNISPVKSSGTIYIRADGSIDPPTAPIQRDGDVYTFTDNIYESIVIQRGNIIVDGAGYTLQGLGSGNGFYLSGINNVTIKGTNIKGFDWGISLSAGASYNTLLGNNITSNYGGVHLSWSSGNVLKNNSMVNNDYNFMVVGYALSHFVHDVDTSNTVDGKPIYYLVSYENIEVPSDAGYVALVNSTNITVKGLRLKNNGQGTLLAYTTNAQIINNNLTDNYYGIALLYSSNNSVYSNDITNNGWCGVWLEHSSDNRLYHNNFINNTSQVYFSVGPSINTWDDGYPSGGNYWSDYAGVDSNLDGIGDTPYVIDENNTDCYPLMHSWSSLPVHNINTGIGYATIQEAINANEILNGHTIFVEAGTYYEHVTINKSLTLVGENRSTTIIDGNGISPGTVVTVTADNVTVSNFAIQNSGGWPEDAGIRLDGSEGSIIINNSMRNNVRSIDLMYSVSNVISGNTISDAGYCGVILRDSHNNTIIGNVIVSNVGQIHGFQLWESNSNTLSNNIVHGSGTHHHGISLTYSDHNNITVNLFLSSEVGINLGRDSNYNKIIENNITLSSKYGILAGAGGNVIYHNNFISNTRQVYSSGLMNTWDDGCEGNYWSDYNGTDSENDGIGDTPYIIDENNTDNYPLMNPYWNPGDVDHDLDVDLYDAVKLLLAYGSTPEDERYNCHCDITEPYGIIDLYDAVLLLVNYGKKYS
jgi:parallel beta-helix repeat protein